MTRSTPATATRSPAASRDHESQDACLRASFAYCREITKARAANFYYGLRLTPEPKRSAMYAIYATLRACDDLADGEHASADNINSTDQTRLSQTGFLKSYPNPYRASSVTAASGPPNAVGNTASEPSQARLKALDKFENKVALTISAAHPDQLPPGPLWPALHHVLRNYPVDPTYLFKMIEAQRQDLRGPEIDTFDDLHAYCYKVASTVGLICVSIWGSDGHPQVTTLAIQRGIALQLTNILRDLREDAINDRIYLPSEELEHFGCYPDQLRAGKADANFDRLMAFQLQRARWYYHASQPLEAHLTRDCRATSATLMKLYRALLDRIAADPRAVLQKRVRLSSLKKLQLAASAWYGGNGRTHRRPVVATPDSGSPKQLRDESR